MAVDKYAGTDNDGRPKREFLERLKAMGGGELRAKASELIWLSAYASNNPRSDFHWQCDAVYDECSRRGKTEIYAEEHRKLVEEAS